MQKNVLEYLDEAVKKYPEKTVFSDENKEFTYALFSNTAKIVAMDIISKTSNFNKPIGVLVNRNTDSLLAFMSVLYSGNFYVPIDCKMPIERIKKVIEQVQPILIIDASEDDNITASFNENVPYPANQILKLNLDKYSGLRNQINESVLAERRTKILDIDPVYIIFTSGSTGIPKGIVISHRSVIDFTDWMSETFGFTSKDVMGNQAPFYFDLSVKDIYTTIKHGATAHIIPKKALMFPTILIDYLNEKKVTSLIWATSAFNLISSSKVLEKKILTSVNKVILGGEALLAKHLNNWRLAMSNIQYVNLYGPTEVTVDCTYYIIKKEFNSDEAVPIGKACKNKEVLLLNETHTAEVPEGQPGEICVRGTGLAKGYFGDFEKTNSVFIQNPLNPYYEDKIYCTGDIGIRDSEGNIVFMSRKDGQIKHMGYRIELGEIERAVNSFNLIKNAICFYDNDKTKIVCIYEGDSDDAQLIKFIQNLIPKYMYPNILKKYQSLPYNANGKIDRVKLKNEYFSN